MISILIADDEERIRSGIRKRIADSGLPAGRIEEAGDGRKALEILGQNPVDIALVDINMPFVNGLAFIEAAKAEYPKTIFIIISGYNRFEYAQEAIRHGVFRYLLKPINTEELRRTLEAAMELVTPGPGYDGDPVLGSIIRHIEEHYRASAYSLGTLAEALGISEGHLSKVLKKQTGLSFSEYLTKLRIGSAQEILRREGRLTRIAEVAERVGFSNQHYFSAVFRKICGCTPSEYLSGDFCGKERV
ncbi:response regulator transcription factor [Breznakiella homolactica]|uniref:Response regulator n=1 Tax=Breznakiella homolactica TaxID=2798577 RepID=A0A7T8BAI7_9SPIR|nr:response regulator [Breznakiella homolactica]QQO09411.1 response regulator [Breznakiella homolactica]